jgi:CDP-diglyceride synthetase
MVWALLKLFAFFAFPQLLGILVFFRIRRYYLLARLAAFLIPIALHVVFGWLFLVVSYYRVHPNERCGGPMLGAIGAILFGLAVHASLGGWVQIFLPRRSTKSNN